jgi:hypothetical protein
MPAPSRARPLPPVGHPSPRRRPAPPPGLRPAAPRPVHRRPRQHRAVPTRLLAVSALVALTLGAGAWYLLGRSSADAGEAGGYVEVEQRYATAAWAVHYTPLVVRQFSELDTFNAALDEQALVMERSLAEFDRIARSEEGEAASIARESVNLAEEGLRAVSEFRDAIVTTNDLAGAHDAIAHLERVVDQLEANAKQWRSL